jgi:hypothetical protein
MHDGAFAHIIHLGDAPISVVLMLM